MASMLAIHLPGSLEDALTSELDAWDLYSLAPIHSFFTANILCSIDA